MTANDDDIILIDHDTKQNTNTTINRVDEQDNFLPQYQSVESLPEKVKEIAFLTDHSPFLKRVDSPYALFFGPILFDPESPDFSTSFIIRPEAAKLLSANRAFIFCVSKSEDAKIYWPANFSFSVNSQLYNAPTDAPPPCTMSFWVDITKSLSSSHQNLINIYSQRSTSLTKFYMFGLILTALTNAELIQSITKHEGGENFNKLYQSSNPDESDVGEAFLSLPLYCPLSQGRIDIPIRSIHCEHLTAMDAASFFSFMRFSGSWVCPICSKSCKMDEIYIDDAFAEIIKRCPYDMDVLKLNYIGKKK